MDLWDAILTRRSIKDFTADPVPAGAVERALSAGVWAPNHRLTQPWRFTVLGPQAQQALAAAAAEDQAQTWPAGDDAGREKAQAGAAQKILSRPVIVVVTYRLSPDQQQRREDFAATCCAIQNIQLAAWADGLGALWSTNRMTRHPATYSLLGVDAGEEEIAGFLYLGYPAGVPAPRLRKPLSEVMRRLP